MNDKRLVMILAGCFLLVACAAPDTSSIARGAAEFVVVGLTQEEYVDACTTRGFSSLECSAEYDDVRRSQQAVYQAQKQREQQQAAEDLSAELDAYLKSAENARHPD